MPTLTLGYMTFDEARNEVHWAVLPDGHVRVCHTHKFATPDFGIPGQWADAPNGLPEGAEYIGNYELGLTY